MRFSRLHRIVCGFKFDDFSEALHDSKEEIDKVDALGNTSLWYAVCFGRMELAKRLLNYGANPNTGVLSPLMTAAYNGDSESFELLLNHGSRLPLVQSEEISEIAEEDHWNLLTGCYTIKSRGWRNGHDPSAIDLLLINHGFDFNQQDRHGQTALMYCCFNFGLEECQTFFESRLSLLLTYGVDLETRDFRGNTAMNYAVVESRALAFEMLIHAGANIDTVNIEGSTMLHLAVLSCKDTQIVEALSRANLTLVDTNAKDSYGASAFDLLKQRAQLYKTRDHQSCQVSGSTLDFEHCKVANTSDKEFLIIIALEDLLRQVQGTQVPGPEQAYPAQSVLTDINGEDESCRVTLHRHLYSIPGAWYEPGNGV